MEHGIKRKIKTRDLQLISTTKYYDLQWVRFMKIEFRYLTLIIKRH